MPCVSVVLLSTIGAVALSWLLVGCDALTGHDELTFDKRPYLGDELRMDGYFYHQYTAPAGRHSSGEITGHDIYFFYRNGVVRYVGSLESLDSLTNEKFMDGTARYEWGLFQVDGDRIAFERWYPPSKTYTVAEIRSGRILNDTTFVITALQRSNGENLTQREETYHFRPFSPKPDSTNRFIK